MHANTYEFYIPVLVQELYDGFSENNIDRNQAIIEVNWRGVMKILHLQTISELTDIPLVERWTQESGNLGNYIHLMGEHCKVHQGVVLAPKYS